MKNVKCPIAVSPDCPGHTWWEAYGTCLARVAVQFPDSETGDCTDFSVWVGLLTQDQSETVDIGDIRVTVPAGTYATVEVHDSGRVQFYTYDTAEQAQEVFDAWDTTYGAFLDAQEHHERQITSGTGRIGA